MNKLFKFFLIPILLVLTACNSTNTTIATPSMGGYPVSKTMVGYPAPSQNVGYPLVTPDKNSVITPTQDKQKAIVKGVLLYNGKPVKRWNLYLGGVIMDSNGKEIIASMDQQKDANCLTQDNGAFTFFNVPPGRYAIILDNGTSAALLLKPKGTEAILLSLKAGDIIDLGKLDYSNLPIPQQ